ncbi:glycogenin [Moelleriella libera RCEF 2490]|uniref:glycogenin glucosyltransferase n=1 Tax=Moelleriella libera RCEF 2490 TaxID=1081109 RepID=A0A168F1K3_9HYPO|nr:glycogenin [Moelleriella libera RCEF 2490]
MSSAIAADGEQLYATLLTNNAYLPGALVLAHSLRDAGTTKKLAALVTLDTVSADAITQLKVVIPQISGEDGTTGLMKLSWLTRALCEHGDTQAVYDYIIPVPRIRNDHSANLHLMNRADLHSAFTKINLWKQTQFSKIVYIDADVVAYRAPDELFDLPHAFSAAPDVGWPDIVNTGVMAIVPNLGDYYAMLAMAERGISFDGADQGLINMHFQHSVNRISFTYNVTPSAHYQYVPAYRHFQSSISLVHFIGTDKPWLSERMMSHGNGPFDEMVGRWWATHDRHYRKQDQNYQEREYPGGFDGTITASRDSSPTHGVQAISQGVEATGPSEATLAGVPNVDKASSADNNPPHKNDSASINQPSHNAGQSPLVSMNNWDAQRQPPPPDSKPEAINFPSAHYEMSRDTNPFIPPARYPSPPKNMWYEVPQEAPSSTNTPRHIFPWEKHQPAPSRSFVEVAPPETAGLFEEDQISSGQEQATAKEDEAASEPTGTQHGATAVSARADYGEGHISSVSSSGSPWNSFTQSNAWDEVPGIGRYVEGLQRHRRAKIRPKAGLSDVPAKPSAGVVFLQMPRAMRVTDFPTEVERPSLPVTPAPIRRPSHWGEDKGDDDDVARSHSLPVAAGVPLQSEWDPAAQLQKLAQQQSEALLRKLSGDDGASGSGSPQFIPSRSLPFGSEPLRSPTYIAQPASSGVLSPRPIAAKIPAGALVESLAGDEEPITTGPVQGERSGDLKV